MEKIRIDPRQLKLQPFTAFDPGGVLLVSGQDAAHANVMTISWGMFGIMWGKPVMMVMVRLTLHTWGFITRAPDFTVNWMDESFADAVALCGSASGRDMDKFAAAGLTPARAQSVQSPVIRESALSLECRTLYRTDLDPVRFLDPSILGMYAAQDYHSLFFGEVELAMGTDDFQQ